MPAYRLHQSLEKEKKPNMLRCPTDSSAVFNIVFTSDSPISTLCGATLATAGEPGSPLALFSLRAALAAMPRHGLLVSRVVLRRLPVSALISELKGMGMLISVLDMWRSGVVLPSPSVWMSFSLIDFFCRRLLISMMLPMISTGPVMVFLRGEKSSFTFFKYEAGAQPSLPKYLWVDDAEKVVDSC